MRACHNYANSFRGKLMQERTKDISACALSYFFAFIISLVILFFYMMPTTYDNLDVDETYYYNQALKLKENNYTLNPYRPFGYPLFLASVLTVASGHFQFAKILIILISALRAPFLYVLAKQITGNITISTLSALMIAVWPPIAFYSATFYTESISSIFFIAFFICLPRTRQGWLAWILAGILLAMLIFIHPMFTILLPFVFAIQFFERTLSKFWLLLLSCLAALSPWTAAISKHEGNFVFVSLNTADSLAGGLNEKIYSEEPELSFAPNGRATWKGPGMWIPDFGYITPEERKNLTASEVNDLLYKRVWEWIKSNPGKAFYLEFLKLMVLWGFYPFLWQLKAHMLFGNIPAIVLLLVSLLAVWKWRNYYRELARLWMMPIFVSCVALISVGSWRYRFPADEMMIILCVMYIYSLFSSKQVIRKLPWM